MLKLRRLVCTALLASICPTVAVADRVYAGDRQGSPEVAAPEFFPMPSGGCAKPAK